MKKLASAVLTTGLLSTVSLFAAPSASAIAPPDINMVLPAPPADGQPKSDVEMEQKNNCAVSALLEGSNASNAAPASASFEVDKLHRFATGRGVKVAVVDSGVSTKNPRLKDVIPGGDYVGNGDGLQDCDHHGTLIASIIAAQPGDKDSFVGVAPDAQIISIRQTSNAYGPKDSQEKSNTSTLATAAAGVVHAVELGANVVNLSVTACYPANSGVDTSDLAAALKYAYDKGVMVVTSAGNADATGCESNPQFDPGNPLDTRNWAGVQNVSMPSYYNPFLISVGGSSLTGEPYQNTMAGPWVDVAAPAVNITSLDPESETGALINASVTKEGTNVYNGTSFSSAYISGLVALLMEKYPEDTLDQLKARIYRTAQGGSLSEVNTIGFGVANPVRALTENVDLSLPSDRTRTPAQYAGGSEWNKGGMTLPQGITLAVVFLVVVIGMMVFILYSLMNSATKTDKDDTRTLSARDINRQRKETRKRTRAAVRESKAEQKRRRKELKERRK